jgi:divalent metal cation (Fe/Co/Zn/Cd) transporter
VVIGVSPGAAVGQGHAAADAVEAAVRRAVPEADVVVHVEPGDVAALQERALAAALGVPRVREVHNVSVLSVGGRTEVSLHLKLPGDLPLDQAHEIATQVEEAISDALGRIDAVETHLEPLTEVGHGREADIDRRSVVAVVEEATGREPRRLRVLHTDEGLVLFLTLGIDPAASLADAHSLASEVEARLRASRPEIADVIVHTEPA